MNLRWFAVAGTVCSLTFTARFAKSAFLIDSLADATMYYDDPAIAETVTGFRVKDNDFSVNNACFNLNTLAKAQVSNTAFFRWSTD